MIFREIYRKLLLLRSKLYDSMFNSNLYENPNPNYKKHIKSSYNWPSRKAVLKLLIVCALGISVICYHCFGEEGNRSCVIMSDHNLKKVGDSELKFKNNCRFLLLMERSRVAAFFKKYEDNLKIPEEQQHIREAFKHLHHSGPLSLGYNFSEGIPHSEEFLEYRTDIKKKFDIPIDTTYFEIERMLQFLAAISGVLWVSGVLAAEAEMLS